MTAPITTGRSKFSRVGFAPTAKASPFHGARRTREGWVVPAGSDERRFAVLDCGDGLRGNFDFFRTYNEWLGSEGTSAILDFLLSTDLEGWEPRKVPHTAALDQQKIESLDPIERYVYSCLSESAALDNPDFEWRSEVNRSAVCDRIRSSVRSGHWGSGRLDNARIGTRIRELIGADDGPQRRDETGRMRTWNLPKLEVARDRAAKTLGLKYPEWS